MDVVVARLQSLAEGLLGQLPLIVLGLIVGVVAFVAGRVVAGALRRTFNARDAALAAMMGRIGQLITVALGVLLGLWVALPSVRFTDVFASLGVTGLILGFALKDLIENFIARVLILWRHPFRVGDQIRSGEHEGTVEEINFRSTVLRAYDGVRVLIPNGRVFTAPVENRTAHRRLRSTVRLGIDQSAAVADARREILAALPEVPGILPDPAPMVLFTGIGDFTNNLEVLYWTEPPTSFSEIVTRSDVTEMLNQRLQAAGISFPVPTRTVRLETPRPLSVAQTADGGM